MDLLSELIYVVQRNDPRSMTAVFPAGSKAGVLFNAILDGKVKTDEEAELLIYKNPGNEKKYLILKKTLVKILSEIVFKTNAYEKNATSHQKLKLIGKKELLIVEKLLDQNVYHNAEKIALKVKAYAEKFQILDLQIDCITHLRTIYTLKGYPKEVELYNIMLKRLHRQFHYEQDAIGFMDVLESKTKYSIGKYREIAEEARQYSMQLRQWQQDLNNPRLKFFQYKIDLIRCYHLNDTREWQYILNRLTDQVNKNTFLQSESFMLYLNLEWARYMRCTANIPGANSYISKALLQSSYEAFNRFLVQELNFDLKIKEENYEDAGKIFLEVKSCRQFYHLDLQDQAAWSLREAYLYFIFLSKNDKASQEKFLPSFPEKFNLPALMSNCKAISKDKKGYNLMLVIIKEAFLKQKHSGDTESSSLLDYYQKYMKDSCEERSRNFIKKFAKATRSEILNEDHRKENKARAHIVATPKNYDAAELIPYETFHDLFLQGTSSVTLQG